MAILKNSRIAFSNEVGKELSNAGVRASQMPVPFIVHFSVLPLSAQPPTMAPIQSHTNTNFDPCNVIGFVTGWTAGACVDQPSIGGVIVAETNSKTKCAQACQSHAGGQTGCCYLRPQQSLCKYFSGEYRDAASEEGGRHQNICKDGLCCLTDAISAE
jgi:hypothetical protein